MEEAILFLPDKNLIHHFTVRETSMHAIFAALFAALFSFCHASTTQHALSQPDVIHDQPVFTAPTRSDVPSSYAEGACSSCRVMNVSYSVR